jgi:hypothetical protein
VPMHLTLRAQAATALGGTLRDPMLDLRTGGQAPAITASATLPGGAALNVSGVLQSAGGGPLLDGPLTLRLPNLPATIAWLRPAAADQNLLAGLARQAELHANLRLSPSDVALSGLNAKFGSSIVTGSGTVTLGPHRALRAALSADHLAWDDMMARLAAGPAAITRYDTDLDLHAASVQLPAFTLANAALQLRTGREGIQVRHFQADLSGLHADASGTMGADGMLADGALELTAPEAAKLPAAWRVPANLWQGPFHLTLSASGPYRQLAAQLRADLGDLRAEAEGRIESDAPGFSSPRLAATVTLRHPGAPRLLAALGVQGAQRWLDSGSLALQAHLVASPGHLKAQDFSLAAAALHLGGQIDADFSGVIPTITGRIDAPNLTIPRFDARSPDKLPIGALLAWQGVIHLHADDISWGAQDIAADTDADITASGGVLAADISAARIAGGPFTGQAVLDSTQQSPALLARASLGGGAMDDLPTLPPLLFSGGTAGFAVDLSGHGNSPATMLATASGTIQATIAGAALAGLDLPQLQQRLTARGPNLRQGLAAAMASGSTGPIGGNITASMADGALTLQTAHLSGAAGTVDLDGTIDVAARTADVGVRVEPAVQNPPMLRLRLVGPWQAPRRATDVRAGLLWAGVRGR